MEGYLNRTPQGRICTEKAYRKLGITPGRGAPARLI